MRRGTFGLCILCLLSSALAGCSSSATSDKPAAAPARPAGGTSSAASAAPPIAKPADASAPRPVTRPDAMPAGESLYETATIAKVGSAAPAISLQDAKGAAVAWESIRNAAGLTVLIFWDETAPTSELVMETFAQDLASWVRESSAKVVAIRRGGAAGGDAASGAAAGGIAHYGDAEGKAYAAYASKYVPRCFIINADGKVAFASVGFQEGLGDEVRNLKARRP